MNNYTIYDGDFTESRLKGIGSSDIPTLAGLKKHYDQTPMTLWEEKMELSEGFQGNEASDWGHRLEPLILDRCLDDLYGEIKPEFISIKMTEFFHPEYPYALAHPDLVIVPDDKGQQPYIIEAKSVGYFSGKRDENPDTGYDEEKLDEEGIPGDVFLQVQWQMMVSGIDKLYVALLHDTNKYRKYGPIFGNVKIQSQCLALARRFWDCIENKIKPEPMTFKDLEIVFPKIEKMTRTISGDELEAVQIMQAEKEKYDDVIKKAEGKIDDIKKAFGLLSEGNSVLADAKGNVLATYSPSSRKSIAEKVIREKHPDIHKMLVDNKLIKETEFQMMKITKLIIEE